MSEKEKKVWDNNVIKTNIIRCPVAYRTPRVQSFEALGYLGSLVSGKLARYVVVPLNSGLGWYPNT